MRSWVKRAQNPTLNRSGAQSAMIQDAGDPELKGYGSATIENAAILAWGHDMMSARWAKHMQPQFGSGHGRIMLN